jgi:hypothetical protein
MLESSFQEPGTIKPFPDPLVAELQRFTTSLIEQGYADLTVRVKVKLVTSFGQWLKRNRLAVRHPPRSGWLGEWGRLKGGCPVGLTRRAKARLGGRD